MKTNLIELFNDKQIRKFTFLNGIFLVVFAVVAIWKWSALPSQLPLFYSLPRSTEQLGSPTRLLILPLFAVLFSIFNLYLASIFYVKERLAAVILTVMAATSTFLLLVTFIKIVFLVV